MGLINAFSRLGRVLVFAALACTATAVVFGGETRMVLLTIALSIGITGFAFSLLGNRLGRVAHLDRSLAATGVAGTATILALRETGVTVNGSPVIEFGLEVATPAHARFETTIRQRVPRLLIGAFLPGSTLNVRVDPADRQHLAIDWEVGLPPSSDAPFPAGRAGEVDELLSTGRAEGFRDVEELLRAGRPAKAIITSMEDAGDMSELGLVEVGAPGDDDRLFIIGLEVKQPGMMVYEVRVGHRVPERLLGRVGPRTTVDVAVDRVDDQAVAIDWSSIRH